MGAPLKTIILPDTVTSIGRAAFLGSAIESVILPDGLKTIDDYAFAVCADVLTFTVERNSWAKQWCIERGYNYTYPDAQD